MSSPTDSSIPVTVNGDGRTVPEDYPLTELLRDLEIDPDNEDEAAGVAVALNEAWVRARAGMAASVLHICPRRRSYPLTL